MAVNQERNIQSSLQKESSQLSAARTNLNALIGAYREYVLVYENKIRPPIKETSKFLSEEEIRQLHNFTQEEIEKIPSEHEQEIVKVCFNSLIHSMENDPERAFSRLSPNVNYFQFYFKDNYGQILGLQEPDKVIGRAQKCE